MTPEKAQEIYHEARKQSYARYQLSSEPVNEQAIILDGFQAVIDAVTKEIDVEYADRLLKMSASIGVSTYDFTGNRSFEAV